MTTIRYALAIGAALVAAASSADAQAGGRVAAIPSAQQIPAGMCQVWIRGIPARQQPAPTDCATARANAPANSRIIYGGRTTHQGAVLDPRDPRLDPTNPLYDPRLDPRNSLYDPRLDPRNAQFDPRLDPRRRRDRDDDKFERKREHEREKLERKRDKERDKELKKERKGKHGDHDGDDEDDDDDDDRGEHRDRRHDGRDDRRDGRVGCVDNNRDGICDNRQRRATVVFPRVP